MSSSSSLSVSSSTRESLLRIASDLKSNSEVWKPRMSALVELEKLVTEEMNSLGMEGEELLSPLLFALNPQLITQITDLRSELVKQAAHTLSFLAENYPGAFTKAATKILPPLLHVASGTNGVIRGHTDPCIKTLVRCCPHQSILSDMIGEFKTTKSKMTKQVILELIEVILHHWQTKMLKKLTKEIEESVVFGLQSAETASRQLSASCALYLNDHFPSRFKAFMTALDARSQKIVVEYEKEKGHEKAINASPEDGEESTTSSGKQVRKSGGGNGNVTGTANGVRRNSITNENAKSPSHGNHNNNLSTPTHSSSASSSSLPSFSMTSDSLSPEDSFLDVSDPLVHLDKSTISIGSHVEVIDPLDLDDVPEDQSDDNYIEYVGRKGMVISIGKLEHLLGEWIGVEIEPMEVKEGENESSDLGGLVNLRRRCLAHLAEPKKKIKVKVDTAAAAKSNGAGLESPSSTKSNGNGTEKGKPKVKSVASHSLATAGKSSAATSLMSPTTNKTNKPTTASPSTSRLLNKSSSAATAISSIPSSATSSSPMKNNNLPTRVPISSPSKPIVSSSSHKSKIPTPNRSRETSPTRHEKDDSSPPALTPSLSSPSSVTSKPPLLRPLSAPQNGNSKIPGPSAVNFHSVVSATPTKKNNNFIQNDSNSSAPTVNLPTNSSPLPSPHHSTPNSTVTSPATAEWSDADAAAAASGRDRLVSIPTPADLPLLIKDHRSHVTDCAVYLQQLNSLLNSCHSNPLYVDQMVKLLGEHLQKSTQMLQGYIKLKKRTITQQKIRGEHDDFLDKMDNFGQKVNGTNAAPTPATSTSTSSPTPTPTPAAVPDQKSADGK